MSAVLKEIIEIDTLRLAHEFLATFTLNESLAVRRFKGIVCRKEESEIRLWIDYLNSLLVDEELPASMLLTLLASLDLTEYHGNNLSHTAQSP